MHSEKIIRYCIAVSLFLAGCKPTLNEPNYSAGETDFSRFVAVGTDLTAGFTDGALTRDGQISSLPAILSASFAKAGGGAFNQPLLSQGNGFGWLPNGSYIGSLKISSTINCLGNSDLAVLPSSPNLSDLQWIGNQGRFNNYGIPSAKSFNLFSQYFGKSPSPGNPYYHRFASDTGGVSGLSSTVLGDAFMQNPTFFSLWIGVNDIMYYAQSGGVGNSSGVGYYDITPVDTFNYAVDFILNSLTSNGADGVVMNIPDIVDIPYYNSIPYNGLILTQAEADAQNILAAAFPNINFEAGANPFVVYTSGSNIRQLKPGEFVLMNVNMDSLRCYGLGSFLHPLSPQNVLDLTEIDNINSAVSKFNSKLSAVSATKNLAFADINLLFKTLKAGIVFNGASYSAKYISGGAFAVDGIHPNSRGYALIANQCIKAINNKYKSTLPEADVNAYSGIHFP